MNNRCVVSCVFTNNIFTYLHGRVMQRVIQLINQLAAAVNTNSALHVQIEDANKAAKRYMEETEQLEQVFLFFFPLNIPLS